MVGRKLPAKRAHLHFGPIYAGQDSKCGHERFRAAVDPDNTNDRRFYSDTGADATRGHNILNVHLGWPEPGIGGRIERPLHVFTTRVQNVRIYVCAG